MTRTHPLDGFRLLGLLAGAFQVPARNRTAEGVRAGESRSVGAQRQAGMDLAEDVLTDVLPEAYRARLDSALADALEQQIPDIRVPLANAILGASAYVNTLVASVLRCHSGEGYRFEDLVPGLLRVATCDLALRAGAAAAVFGVEIPDRLPRFADPKQRAFPVEEVGRALECQTLDAWADHFPRSTVAEWLSGSAPSAEALPALAAPVARQRKRSVAEVVFAFRAFYALRKLTDTLREGVTLDLAPLMLHGAQLARRATALLRDDGQRRRTGPLMLWGLQYPAAPRLLEALSRADDDATWRFALRAIAENGVEYLRYSADVECAHRGTEGFCSGLDGGSVPGRLMRTMVHDEFLGEGPALDPHFAQVLSPSDRALLLELAARHARLSGDRARALALLTKAVATTPDNVHVIVAYATAVAESGDRKRAVRLLHDAARIQPDWDVPNVEIARVELGEGSPEGDARALFHWEAIQARTSWSPDFGHVRGLALLRARMYDEASECYERLLADNPSDPVALDRAARCDLVRARGKGPLHIRGVRRAKQALALGARDTYRAWREGEFRAG